MMIKEDDDMDPNNQKDASLFEQQTLSLLYASFGVSLTYMILFFAELDKSDWLKWFYLSLSALFALLFVAAIEILKEHKETLLSKWLLNAYPFLLVTLGVLSFHVVQLSIYERVAFLLMMLIVTISTLKGFKYTLVLYLFALLSYNLSYAYNHSFPSTFLLTSVMVILLFFGLNRVFNRIITRLYAASRELKSVNAQFHASLNQLEKTNYRLEHTKNISDMMMSLMTEIIHSEDTDRLLNTILEKAIAVIPNAQAGTLLIKEDDHMVYKAAHGYDLDTLKKIHLRIEDTFEHKLGNKRKPAIIRNSHAFNLMHASKAFTKQMEDSQIPSSQSVITCPIFFNHEYYGSINLDNLTQENAFFEDDKPIIKYLANQIGLVLNHRQLLEKTLYSAKHDALTGVYTRIYHNERLNEIYKHAMKHQQSFCIALIDLNDLKKTNDQWGHQTGDQFLQYFVKHARHFIDPQDIFSRTGGDEFTLIFKTQPYYKAMKTITDMKAWFDENPMQVGNKRLTVTFGAGIACYPEDGKLLTSLSEVADKRMYEDKRISKK
mgnify:CR=1 FL=1